MVIYTETIEKKAADPFTGLMKMLGWGWKSVRGVAGVAGKGIGRSLMRVVPKVGTIGSHSSVSIARQLEHLKSVFLGEIGVLQKSAKGGELVEQAAKNAGLIQAGAGKITPIKAMAYRLDDIHAFVGKAHAFGLRNPHLAEQVNLLVKSGKYEEVAKLMKVAGRDADAAQRAAAGYKELIKFTDELGILQANANKASKVPGFLISEKLPKMLASGLTSLHMPGAGMTVGKSVGLATGVVSAAPFAFGAIFGETNKAIKENQEIARAVVSKLNAIEGNEDPAGRTWTKERDNIVVKLSDLFKMNLKKYPDLNNVPAEQAGEVYEELADITERLQENVMQAYSVIVSPGFRSTYEAGAEGTGKAIGGYVDTVAGWATGNVTDFGQAVDLAGKGIEQLSKSLNDMLKAAPAIRSDAVEHNAEQEQSVKKAMDYTSAIERTNIHSAITDVIAARFEKQIVKKAATGAVGIAGSIFTLWMAGSEAVNLLAKGYIKMGSDWDSLYKNTQEIVEHLTGFVDVRASKPEVEKFIGRTKGITTKLADGMDLVKKNFPFDIIKVFKDGIDENSDKLKQLAAKNAGGKSQMDLVEEGLNSMVSGFNELLDPAFYADFDKNAESYWHSFTEVFEFMSTFTGENAISEFNRVKIKSRRALAIATTLLNELKKTGRTAEVKTANIVLKRIKRRAV